MIKNTFFLAVNASTLHQVEQIVAACNSTLSQGVQLVIFRTHSADNINKFNMPEGVMFGVVSSEEQEAHDCVLESHTMIRFADCSTATLGYAWAPQFAALSDPLELCDERKLDGLFLHGASFGTLGVVAAKLAQILTSRHATV